MTRKATLVSICDAKIHLSQYLDKLDAGEVIIICKHNKPVAELRPLPPNKGGKSKRQRATR